MGYLNVRAAIFMVVAFLAGSAVGADQGPKLKFIAHHVLNEMLPKVDGQWQGITLASDGNVYFGVGSHSARVGAAFVQYNPLNEEMKVLSSNITLQCGETPGKAPDQGKIHSEVIEHKGWIYFGTHLADYSGWGVKNYTGGHLVGYELATGNFRDFGVIHPNYTNYSGIGLDEQREKMWLWVTPFGEGDGARLYRVDLKTAEKESGDRMLSGNRSVMYFFTDRKGDCWFTATDGPGGNQRIALFAGRAETGKLERYAPDVIGSNYYYNWVAKPIDGDRALVHLLRGTGDGMFYIFDVTKFDGVSLKSALKPLCKSDFSGISGVVCHDGKRFYWTCGGEGNHLWSSRFDRPDQVTDFGVLRDPDGRMGTNICSMVADGHGRLYVVGRWAPTESDVNKGLAMKRPGGMVVVYFSILDVSEGSEANN
jgi:hypothetical protein